MELFEKQFNPELYKTDFHWKDGEYDVYRTCHWSAPGCHDSCGLLLYVKDGKLERVEGDPNQPYNRGRLCMRCLNLPEACNETLDRLKWPVKRVGERGENKWERISWDEAYDIIVENVRRIQGEWGAEAICGMIGTGRNVCWQNPLICYAGFGSPNMGFGFLSGDCCMVPRTSLAFCVCGDLPVVDASQFNKERWDHPEYQYPEVVLIWGNDVIKSNGDGFLGHWIVDMMTQGDTKLIVVDPDLTWLASRADIWIQPRPGVDSAIAMAMTNVIIQEDLYDHDFVENWTYGFDKLVERVKDMTPGRAADRLGRRGRHPPGGPHVRCRQSGRLAVGPDHRHARERHLRGPLPHVAERHLRQRGGSGRQLPGPRGLPHEPGLPVRLFREPRRRHARKAPGQRHFPHAPVRPELHGRFRRDPAGHRMRRPVPGQDAVVPGLQLHRQHGRRGAARLRGHQVDGIQRGGGLLHHADRRRLRRRRAPVRHGRGAQPAAHLVDAAAPSRRAWWNTTSRRPTSRSSWSWASV